jgi:hypothetical protein
MERQGSLKESLRLAGETIAQGYILLIFPEGTRSPTGEMRDFKPSLGFLAMANKVDVLPMYLEGTFDAWPKGRPLPKPESKITAHIGPVLSYAYLRERTLGLPRGEAYRVVSAIAEEAVCALRDGRKWSPKASTSKSTSTSTKTTTPTATATPTPAKTKGKAKAEPVSDNGNGDHGSKRARPAEGGNNKKKSKPALRASESETDE